MQSSKLISILSTFNKQEFSELLKFVRSPFFNEHEQVLKLYEYILKYKYDLSNKNLNKELAFAKIVGGKYNDLKMRHLMANLLKLVERYLATKYVKNNEIAANMQLAVELGARAKSKQYSNAIKKGQQLLEKRKTRDGDFYYYKFRFEREYSKYIADQRIRTVATNVEQTLEYLDIFYLINKLRYCCELLNYKKVMAIEFEIFLMEEILSHLKEKNYTHIPAISIYYNILLSLQDDGNEQYFSNITSLLNNHWQEFTKREARDMYIFAENYCIRKINTGNSDYLRQLIGLYQSEINNGIVLEDGFLSPWFYKNAVIAGLRLGDFKWVFTFIKDNKNKMEADVRENAYLFNIARYHFYKKDFEKVIPNLLQVEYDDVFYGIDSRKLLLQTYYELNEVEAMYSLMDSFRTLLKRNKTISETHLNNNLNLIRFVGKLLAAKNQPPKLKKLRAEIEKTPSVAEKRWLMEKVA